SSHCTNKYLGILIHIGTNMKLHSVKSRILSKTPSQHIHSIKLSHTSNSIYTPIRNVRYAVEPYRVEQKTDYDKLVLEVTTDGSIHPKDALKEAAKILIYHFMLFSDEKITLEVPDQDGNQEFDEEILHMRQLLKTKLVDMNLSVRALNCLKAADVETLGDLVQYNKTDLLKFRNFGKKSLSELDDLLESLNLSFGTDIAKYKLDKE
ncbi:MAG: DNA-directed RNA polymerase subunit alpha C-terminal domain-containing protein, partial [Segatella oulorum]